MTFFWEHIEEFVQVAVKDCIESNAGQSIPWILLVCTNSLLVGRSEFIKEEGFLGVFAVIAWGVIGSKNFQMMRECQIEGDDEKESCAHGVSFLCHSNGSFVDFVTGRIQFVLAKIITEIPRGIPARCSFGIAINLLHLWLTDTLGQRGNVGIVELSLSDVVVLVVTATATAAAGVLIVIIFTPASSTAIKIDGKI